MNTDPQNTPLLAACTLISALTIAVECWPQACAEACCPELLQMAHQVSEAGLNLWSDRNDEPSAMSNIGQLALRLEANSLESAAFRFISADLSPARFGSISVTVTWKEWLTEVSHPATALKALCLVVTYLTLNPLNLWMTFDNWRRPGFDPSDGYELFGGLIGATGALFVAGVLIPAMLNWMLGLVHPLQSEEGRVMFNCLHLIAWLAVWAICWLYGFIMFGIRLIVVPVTLVVTSPILLLHGWLFG